MKTNFRQKTLILILPALVIIGSFILNTCLTMISAKSDGAIFIGVSVLAVCIFVLSVLFRPFVNFFFGEK